MAASFNRVILVGNLTRDIEMRSTGGGLQIAKFGLAVNDRVKKGDEWVDETMFIDITCFGRQAEIAEQYLSKGSPVLVEGRLKLNTWDDRDSGQKRSKHEVICDRFQMLGGKDDRSGGGGGGSSRGSNNSRRNRDDYDDEYGGSPASQSSGGAADDDIPF